MEKTKERTNLTLLKENNNNYNIYGHVDGTAIVTRICKNKDTSIKIYIKINKVDNFQNNWIVNRGSIALNGTSLTVAELYDNEFS